jgi:hypothetical protein
METKELLMAFLMDEGFVASPSSKNRIRVQTKIPMRKRPEIFLHVIDDIMIRCGHEKGATVNLHDPDSFRKIAVMVMKCLNQTLITHGYPSCAECDLLNLGIIAKPKGLS